MIPPKATLVFEVELMNIQDGSAAPKKPRPNVFGMVDKDGDKKITPDEVREYLARKGKKSDEDPEKLLADVFEKEDKDKDGIISFEEFSGPKHEEL